MEKLGRWFWGQQKRRGFKPAGRQRQDRRAWQRATPEHNGIDEHLEQPVISTLDQPAISGCYLFPQPSFAIDPFVVEVEGIELACFRRIVNPGPLLGCAFPW